MKCPGCPVIGPCIYDGTEPSDGGLRRGCYLVSTRPEYRQLVREQAGEAPEGTAAALAGPIAAAALSHARACRHRTETRSCSCSGVCALSHGLGGFASLDDCAGCEDHTPRA